MSWKKHFTRYNVPDGTAGLARIASASKWQSWLTGGIFGPA